MSAAITGCEGQTHVVLLNEGLRGMSGEGGSKELGRGWRRRKELTFHLHKRDSITEQD